MRLVNRFIEFTRLLYANTPIRLKFIMWWLPFLFLSVIFLGTYSYFVSSNAITSKIMNTQIDYLNQVTAHLDYINQDALDFSNFLFLSADLQEYLNTENSSLTMYQELYSTISKLLVTKKSIDSVVILKPNDRTIYINNKGYSSNITYNDMLQSNFYNLVNEKNGAPLWTLIGNQSPISQLIKSMSNQVVLIKILRNSSTLQEAGFLMLGLNRDVLNDRLNAKLTQGAKLLILNGEGEIIQDSGNQWIGHSFKDLGLSKEFEDFPTSDLNQYVSDEWILLKTQSSINDWKIVLIQPRKVLVNEMLNLGLWILLVIFLSFILMLFVSLKASNIMVLPIREILESMRKVQNGDFNHTVVSYQRDEIGSLARGYNIMLKRIDSLINDVYKSELREREAEIRALQAQMSPHFLYNTLNTISWTARQRNDAQLADMVYSLSQIFRLSLNDGRDSIELNKELEIVEHYLKLQLIRFSNRLEYEIVADPNSKHILIPKLLIQPFVENAIIHGLEPLDRKVFLSIKVSCSKYKLEIEINDNGVGISEERLSEIKKFTKKNHTNTEQPKNLRSGFAYHNCIERLNLRYGENASISLKSQVGKGTCVHLSLPY
jgi:two-component system sensor histidine kinase YesM